MVKIYILLTAALAAFVFSAFWAGGRIAASTCRAEFAAGSAAAAAAAQQKQNLIKGKINAEVLNTGAADIRGRLRAKYTIAD